MTPGSVIWAVIVGDFSISTPVVSRPQALASPKSRILTLPSGVIMMFAGLQVAVDDSFLMGRLEPFGNLAAGLERLINQEGPFVQPRLERLPFRQLKHKEATSLRFLESMYRRDIGVVQDGQDLSLPLESGHSLLVLGKGRRKGLDGDMATEILIESPIDLPHPASAYLSENFVAAGVNSPRGDKADRRLEGFGEGGGLAFAEISAVAQLPQNRDVSGLST